MTETNNKAMTWTGWILTALLGAAMIMAASMMVNGAPEAKEELGKVGYPAESIMLPLGIVVIVAAVLYLIPRTAVLGAILLTGYFGGAVATHLIKNDGMWFIPVIAGALAWLALVLRDPRLRSIVPFRLK